MSGKLGTASTETGLNSGFITEYFIFSLFKLHEIWLYFSLQNYHSSSSKGLMIIKRAVEHIRNIQLHSRAHGAAAEFS